jgi:hypothetical protein
LQVVDGEQEGLGGGERTQGAENADADGAPIRSRAFGLAQEEGDLERPLLRSREGAEDLLERLPEQVADRGEGEARLGLHRARRENAEPRPGGRRGPRPQERGLADPGLALEQQRAGERLGRLEEGDDGGKLLVPADEGGGSRSHAGSRIMHGAKPGGSTRAQDGYVARPCQFGRPFLYSRRCGEQERERPSRGVTRSRLMTVDQGDQ